MEMPIENNRRVYETHYGFKQCGPIATQFSPNYLQHILQIIRQGEVRAGCLVHL